MDLTFVKTGNSWVAEFEATANFNLHIERGQQGRVSVYQGSDASGDYATAASWSDFNAPKVMDVDFCALVYPKRIKVTTDSEPTKAVVTISK